MSIDGLRGARVICPASGLDARRDVALQGGRIKGLLPPGTLPDGPGILDVPQSVICPAFVDLHVDFGAPGAEWREGMERGLKAAAMGGFGAIVHTPATHPVNDTAALCGWFGAQSAAAGATRVLPMAALTEGRSGARLTEMFELRDAGAVAFGDERWIADTALLRRAVQYAAAVGRPVFERPEDAGLAGPGVMHEGAVSTRLGLKGIPAAAESIAVFRAVALAEQTGAPIHIGPISAAGSVKIIADAKARGVPVTASVAVANLVWLDTKIAEAFDPVFKISPPLREAADRSALREGVRTGVIDAVSSGHAPWTADEKAVEFDLAKPGMSTLEICLSLLLDRVAEGAFDLTTALAALSAGGWRSLRQPAGRVEIGARADLVVFDPERRTRIDPASRAGRGQNCPADGQAVRGEIQLTLVAGKPAFSTL